MPILDQKLERFSNGKLTLKNTMDIYPAMKLAQEMRDMGNNGFTEKRTQQCLAVIPNWMWNVNPWLVASKRARFEGNDFEAQKYFKKFLKLFPQFQVARNL